MHTYKLQRRWQNLWRKRRCLTVFCRPCSIFGVSFLFGYSILLFSWYCSSPIIIDLDAKLRTMRSFISTTLDYTAEFVILTKRAFYSLPVCKRFVNAIIYTVQAFRSDSIWSNPRVPHTRNHCEKKERHHISVYRSAFMYRYLIKSNACILFLNNRQYKLKVYLVLSEIELQYDWDVSASFLSNQTKPSKHFLFFSIFITSIFLIPKLPSW